MSCPTMIPIRVGEAVTLKATHIDPLTKRAADLTGAKVEFLCEAFTKATANVIGGGADQIITGGTNGTIEILIKVIDTATLEVKSYPFQLWVTYPDEQRYVVDYGVVNVGNGRAP